MVGVGQTRAINANLVISVAPTVSHGRNKYLLATVKTSSIAPSVYDPAPSRHFITVSLAPELLSTFPVSFDRTIDQTTYVSICMASERCPTDFTSRWPVVCRGRDSWEKNSTSHRFYGGIPFLHPARMKLLERTLVNELRKIVRQCKKVHG